MHLSEKIEILNMKTPWFIINFYNSILITFRSAMEWSEDLALVREVLITEPYRFKARTTERGKIWQQIELLKFALEEIRGFLEKLES